MDLGLDGKVALVTGASKGIGRGIAAELVAEGARVAISSHSRERVEATAAEIGATAFVHDTADLDHAAALVAEVDRGARARSTSSSATPAGRPAGPTPSASRASSGRPPTRRSSSARWRSSRRSSPACASAASAAWSTSRRPACASRSRTCMLSNAHRISMVNAFKTIARQVAADGVTLNTVLPGRIDTDRLAELLGSPRGRRGPRAEQEVPAGRLGTRRGVRGRRRVALLGARELRHGRDGRGRRRAAAVGVLSGSAGAPRLCRAPPWSSGQDAALSGVKWRVSNPAGAMRGRWLMPEEDPDARSAGGGRARKLRTWSARHRGGGWSAPRSRTCDRRHLGRRR